MQKSELRGVNHVQCKVPGEKPAQKFLTLYLELRTAILFFCTSIVLVTLMPYMYTIKKGHHLSSMTLKQNQKVKPNSEKRAKIEVCMHGITFKTKKAY